MARNDKTSITALTAIFVLINLPPDTKYLYSFKNIVLGFGYILGGCILSALGGMAIAAVISMAAARVRKNHTRSLDTAKLILLCSIAVGLLLRLKK